MRAHANGLSALMRPILLALSLAVAAVPALEKVCDLRCATIPQRAAAPAGATPHCDGMPAEEGAPATPAPARSDDPCGHGHGGTAILGASASTARSGLAPSPPAVLCASGGSGLAANLPARDATFFPRAAESPPRSASRTILRL